MGATQTKDQMPREKVEIKLNSEVAAVLGTRKDPGRLVERLVREYFGKGGEDEWRQQQNDRYQSMRLAMDDLSRAVLKLEIQVETLSEPPGPSINQEVQVWGEKTIVEKMKEGFSNWTSEEE